MSRYGSICFQPIYLSLKPAFTLAKFKRVGYDKNVGKKNSSCAYLDSLGSKSLLS